MVNWHLDAILGRPFATYTRTLRDHCGELFRLTWMSTSSDNVPFSTSNWELENKRPLSSRPLLSLFFLRECSRPRKIERKVAAYAMPGTRKATTSYWTLQGQFSSTMSATLFSSVCVLLRKSRVTQVYPRFFRRRRYPPPARRRQRNSGSGRVPAQFSGNDEEERPDARARARRSNVAR